VRARQTSSVRLRATHNERCAPRCDNYRGRERLARRTAPDRPTGGKSWWKRLTALLGDEDDARRDALRCLDAGGTTGFILAPGCDLPYDVPARNLEVVAELAHDEYQREVARTTLGTAAERTESVTLPDYRQEPQVIVDVVTWTRRPARPCQYMMDAVHGAATLGIPIVIREHKIKTMRASVRCASWVDQPAYHL
jgi:uroporphyrinogen decarboxylase